MKTTSEVKAELARRGVDTSGLLERSELEEALASSDYYAEASANQGAHAYCRHCGGGDDSEGNDILLCDGVGCPEAWHMQCLTPRLRNVPKGLWLCPTCSAQARDKNQKRSVAAMSLGAIKAELVERKIPLARGLEKEEAVLALVAARRKEEHTTVDNQAPPASSPLKRKAQGASDDEDATKSPGATLNDTLAQLQQMQRVQQQRDAREAEARQAREAVEKAAARAAERAAVEKAEREAAEAGERKAAEEALKAAEEEAGQAAERAGGQAVMETTSSEIASGGGGSGSGSGSGSGDGSGSGHVDERGATAAGTVAAKSRSAARDDELNAARELGGETELGSGSPPPRQGKRQKVGSGADRAEPSAEPSQREPSQGKPSQAKPSQVKSSRAKSKQVKPSQREPSTAELATTIQMLLRGEDLETITSRDVRVRSRPTLTLGS